MKILNMKRKIKMAEKIIAEEEKRKEFRKKQDDLKIDQKIYLFSVIKALRIHKFKQEENLWNAKMKMRKIKKQ